MMDDEMRESGGAEVACAEMLYESTAAETSLDAATPDHSLRVPYYCEENVWRLAYRKKHELPDDRYWVVFISNAIKNVPMFQQRASIDPETCICWDYHVILLISRASDHSQVGVQVYDIDSYLPYPCPLADYLQRSFPYECPVLFRPLFRVVDAELFLQYFSSDRSHMFNKETGTWKATPPTYAPIQSGMTSSPNNLPHYLDFVQRPNFTEIDAQVFGTILTKEQLATANFAA